MNDIHPQKVGKEITLSDYLFHRANYWLSMKKIEQAKFNLRIASALGNSDAKKLLKTIDNV